MLRVAFTNLTPDQPSLDNGGLLTANNCIPYEKGYGPFPEPATASDALAAAVRSAFAARDTSEAVTNFAGTETKLYRLGTASWSDVTRFSASGSAALNYAIGTEGVWEFAVFQDTVIAVGGNVNQIWSLGSSTRFATLSGSAPLMAHIATVRDFVVGGNMVGAPNRVQWSAISNPLDWNVSPTTQSDYQDLIGDNSRVQKVVGGEFGLVLTENSVWRMTYAGPPVVFQFDQVESSIGCYASGSVARSGGVTFFLSDTGFFTSDGQSVRPIGNGQVDRSFFDDLDSNYLYRISSTIDPFNKLYIVSYPGRGNTSGLCSRLIIYNWATGRWATADQVLEFIYSRLTDGYTLEGLDAISSSLDALPYSLDSRAWVGGLKLLAGFDSTHKLISFNTGSYKQAEFITGEAQLTPGRRTWITSSAPLVEGSSSSIEVSVGQRETLTDTVAYTTASTRNAIGRCPLRANGRYQRVRLAVTGGFSQVQGIDLEINPNGVR